MYLNNSINNIIKYDFHPRTDIELHQNYSNISRIKYIYNFSLTKPEKLIELIQNLEYGEVLKPTMNLINRSFESFSFSTYFKIGSSMNLIIDLNHPLVLKYKFDPYEV
jgi:hypothetical protein